MDRIIRCVAIDDEPLALEIIEKFCRRIGGIELKTFSDPILGLQAINEELPNIAFLDIEMENISGLEIAAKLPDETCFIFTTAYLSYALNGFDLDAVDYLHKPFAFSRFQMAFERALRRLGLEKLKSSDQILLVKQEYNSVSIPVDDILYIEAMEGYSKIFRASGICTVTRMILKNILALLPQSDFMRIHRSFAVSKSKIRSFNRRELTLCDGKILPVGRQYAMEVAKNM